MRFYSLTNTIGIVSFISSCCLVAHGETKRIDQRKFTISGTLWSDGKKRVWVKKKSANEYYFYKTGKRKSFEAIGPFVNGGKSIFGLEYNLDVEHESPFILNFDTWEFKRLKTAGVLFDCGFVNDQSVYWALEGLDMGKTVDTFLCVYSQSGDSLLRQKVVNPGLNTVVLNGSRFDVNVRLARQVDLLN